MNAHEAEPIETDDHHDTGEQHAVPLLSPHDHGDDVKPTRTLADLLGEPEPSRLPHDVQWFAANLLAHPGKAVQTAPVIAMVAELLDILRDEHVSDQQAHHALCRAVRWLQVFTEQLGTPDRPHQSTGRRDYAVSKEGLAAAVTSRQLAATWLRGTPQAAIRTEPVIGVVSQLIDDLLYSTSNRDAQSRLRRAVHLLDVFATADSQPISRP
jgi:hypothetical protein